MDFSELKERRKYARLAISSKLLVCVEERKGAPACSEFKAIGKNVGAEGILFITDRGLDPGTMITLKIEFPNTSKMIDVKGVIKWCNPVKEIGGSPQFFDCGVEFVNVDNDHLRILVRHVCGEHARDIAKDI